MGSSMNGSPTRERAWSRLFVRLGWLASCAPAAVALVAACSSSTDAEKIAAPDAAADAGGDVLTVAPVDAAPAACTLLPDIGSGRKVCDDCLQNRCCVVMNACFSDKPCEDLNGCINDCGARLGRGDAGAQCVRACAVGKDEAATMVLDMVTCQNERCGTDCKQ